MTSNRTAAEYRQAQEILYGAAGVWAHDTFVALNAQYFANAVPHRGILWGLLSYGGKLGLCNGASGRIILHTSLLDPRSAHPWDMQWSDLGESFACDVLLHEMLHAYLGARRENPKHNAAPWCREIERLAIELGIGPVRAQPVKPRRVDGKLMRRALPGHLTQDQLSRFPYSLRPPGYNEAANGKQRIRL
jgi:hypothetical protein